MIKISLISMLFFSLTACSSKSHLHDQEEVVQEAKRELDASMTNGEFKEFGSLNELKGSFSFNITIHKNGQVVTVHAEDRDGSVDHQNKLKDFIKAYQFNFKMPKGRSYKFEYTFLYK